jgi:hemoglobin
MTIQNLQPHSVWLSISKTLIMAALALALALAMTLLYAKNAQAEDEASLFERLGGTYNIAQTVDHLVDLIYDNKGLNANPTLAAIHADKSTKAGFKVMLTNWVVQETGGPKIYKPDSFGRGKSMKDSHPHLNISNREFDIIKTLCLATFYHYNVGNHEIDQLMDDLESYRHLIVTREDEAPFKSRLVKEMDGMEYRTE